MNDNARSLVAEFIGTFALIFIGCGSVIMTSNALAPNGGINAGLVAVALAHGLTIAVIVSVIGHVSGGHINPAVTAGLWITGQIETIKAGTYWVAQLLGAAVAALALQLIMPETLTDAVGLGTPAINTGAGMGVGAGVVLEAILTFFLVFAVYGTAVDPQGAFNKVAGFSIGLVVTFDILAGGPMTGAAMNPARWFGPALVSGTWTDSWVYIVGPLAGGILAGLAGRMVFDTKKPVAA